MTSASAAWRTTATGCVVAVMLVATVWGYSDHFPFTPMTQFAGSVAPDDDFRSPLLAAVDESGREWQVRFERFGIRRAEFEGQMRHHRGDPVPLLSLLARAYERFDPDAAPLVELRLIYRTYTIRARKVRAIDEEVVAVWRR